jgi:hypothetical protein
MKQVADRALKPYLKGSVLHVEPLNNIDTCHAFKIVRRRRKKYCVSNTGTMWMCDIHAL